MEAPASTARLEAFSDGVFAIAITLLILDLRVPRVLDLAADLQAPRQGPGVEGLLDSIRPQGQTAPGIH